MSGAYLTLAANAPAPNGFTLVGTTTITYRDTDNVVHDSTVKLYQKNEVCPYISAIRRTCYALHFGKGGLSSSFRKISGTSSCISGNG